MNAAPGLTERGQRFLLRLRQGFLDPANNRRIARIVALGLLVLVTWTAAGLTWQWLTPPPPLPEAGSVAPARTPPGETPVSIRALVATHLFGQASVIPVSAKGPIVAPETRLRLSLHGVSSDDPKLALAIIAKERRRLGPNLPAWRYPARRRHPARNLSRPGHSFPQRPV